MLDAIGGWLADLRRPLLSDEPSPPPERLPASPSLAHQPPPPPISTSAKKPEKKRSVTYVPALTAAAEQTAFPYDPRCMHCSTMLRPAEARWGSGLCDPCYGACEKECGSCGTKLALRQLHWNSGMCDACYDAAKKRPAAAPASLPMMNEFDPSVRTCIAAQLVFYMAPAIMVPSLYLQLQECVSLPGFVPGGMDAASAYAAVLTTTTVVAMAAPIPFGMWAERRGEREVYVGVTLAATLAALVLAIAPYVTLFGLGLPIFAMAWGCLSAPLSLRGVRAAYFARHVAPSDLSRAGQYASAAGLIGSVLGPLLAAICRNAFVPAALFAAAAHAFAAVALLSYLPADPKAAARSRAHAGKGSKGGGEGGEVGRMRLPPPVCERCARPLTDVEKTYATQLCDGCWDNWFRRFRTRLLVAFCLIAALLELAMNAAVIAPFQPVAVEHFGWGSDQIAAVNLLSATLSVLVSIAVAQLRLHEWAQAVVASALYVAATLIFSWPPLQESRLVVGLVIGLKAQILFMAPFTAAFSRLIGGPRVTNALTTMLCLAPLIGAAIGTAIAPALIPFAGTPLFMATGLPAVAAMGLLIAGWRMVGSAGAQAAREGAASPVDRGLATKGTCLPVPTPPRLPRHSKGDRGWASLAGPLDLDSPRLLPQRDTTQLPPIRFVADPDADP